jgi:hypothetical protein
MKKFDFLIGNWRLEYTIPETSFSAAGSGEGEGIFSRVLKDNYVVFDYQAVLTTGTAQAHVIYAKDKGNDCYRCWWFEDTGNFETASCNFVDESTLLLKWVNSPLIQTFKQVEDNHVGLTMATQIDDQTAEAVLLVDMFKRTGK